MQITIIKRNGSIPVKKVFKNKSEFFEYLKSEKIETHDQEEVMMKIKHNKYISCSDLFIAFANKFEILFGQ